jgi:hypothetical protein
VSRSEAAKSLVVNQIQLLKKQNQKHPRRNSTDGHHQHRQIDRVTFRFVGINY